MITGDNGYVNTEQHLEILDKRNESGKVCVLENFEIYRLL